MREIRFLPAALILIVLNFGLRFGYQIGIQAERTKHSRTDYIFQKKLEVFTNPAVFHHCEYVSRLRHVSLYQVLTGQKEGN